MNIAFENKKNEVRALIVHKDMDSVQYILERLKRESDGLEAIFSQVSEAKSETKTKPEGQTK